MQPERVRAAANTLQDHVVRTPLLEASTLNELVAKANSVKDVRVLVKVESLQHTGAFKFRGATNRLLSLSEDERRKGVVAFSSGNFAQALALASRNTGTNCTIVSPHDAPQLKLQRTRDYGATVLLSTAAPGENREIAASAMARKFAQDHSALLLHPFDDYEVMYGQGTLALEVLEQMSPDLPTHLVVPTGGGGMLAGCCMAVQLESPDTKVYAVEPQGYDDHVQSFRNGLRTPLSGTPVVTICDALQASAPGVLTWGINREAISGAVSLSDQQVIRAMKVAFTELKLVLEPSGALGLAALLEGRIPVRDGDSVVVVASGGNIALENYVELMQQPTT